MPRTTAPIRTTTVLNAITTEEKTILLKLRTTGKKDNII